MEKKDLIEGKVRRRTKAHRRYRQKKNRLDMWKGEEKNKVTGEIYRETKTG